MLDTTRISVRVPSALIESVDHLAFTRRVRQTPGRSATRSAVIVDLLKRGLAQNAAAEPKETQS